MQDERMEVERVKQGSGESEADRVHAAVGNSGRVIVRRLLPGVDLIGGLEGACDEFGFAYASVVAYGSLASAEFMVLGPEEEVGRREEGPLVPLVVSTRVEFLGGQGLVCRDANGVRATHLHGCVADATGSIRGGHFIAGKNRVLNNVDFVLTELVGVSLTRVYDVATNTVEMIAARAL